jgi:hypothetical protein
VISQDDSEGGSRLIDEKSRRSRERLEETETV